MIKRFSTLICLFSFLFLAVFASGGCGGGGGAGSVGQPRAISSAEELAAIRDDLSGNYVLTADIDLSEYTDWEPIGTFEAADAGGQTPVAESAFTGTFDGRGYTISNVIIEAEEGEMGVGIFGVLAGSASITNLNVENVTVNASSSRVGGVVGYAYCTDDDGEILIENVHLTGNNRISGKGLVGGIVGGILGVYIKDCSAEADLTVDGNFLGGDDYGYGIQGTAVGILTGGGEAARISGSEVSGGSVAVSGDYACGIGGFVGSISNYDGTLIEDSSVSNVTITVNSTASNSIGGMAGYSGNSEEDEFPNPGYITGCSVSNVEITVPESGAERIGMITGGSYYSERMKNMFIAYGYSEDMAWAYMAQNALRFTVSNCSVSDSTISGGTIVGSVAGYAYGNSSVDQSSCTVTNVTINASGGQMVGGTESDYPLSDLN